MAMTSSKRNDANHVQNAQLGGSARRSDALVVLPSDWHFEPDGVPATRADCPPPYTADDTPTPGRLCPHIHCTHNLWLVAGVDRPGRRWEGGRTENTINMYTPHNCELDVSGGREVEPGRIAAVLGITDRQVRRKAEAARRKLAASKRAKQMLEEKTKR